MYNNVEAYREKIALSVLQAGIDAPHSAILTDRILDLMAYSVPLRDIPHPFFDIPRSIRILSRQEQIAADQAQEHIIAKPELLFDIHDLPLKPREERDSFENWALKKPLTLDAIEATARAFRADRKSRPHTLDGIITHPPLADGSLTWGAVSSAFRYGARGLKDSGYASLPAFLNARLGGNILSLDTIEETARNFLADPANKGRRPTSDSGLITHPPLANDELTWGMVHGAFRWKTNGLENSPYNSLPEFLDSRFGDSSLNLDDIEATARAFQLDPENKGRRPAIKTGLIIHPPLADGYLTWNAVSQAFADGGRGLKGCGYKSLPVFLDKRGLPKIHLKRGPIAQPVKASRIFRDAVRKIIETGDLPLDKKDKLADMSVSNVGRLFHEENVIEWEAFVIDPEAGRPGTLRNFLSRSGLITIDKRKVKIIKPNAARQLAARHSLIFQ